MSTVYATVSEHPVDRHLQYLSPTFFMAENDSGGMTAIVAIIAIIVILGIGFLIFKNMGGGAPAATGGGSIDVNLPAGDGNAQ